MNRKDRGWPLAVSGARAVGLGVALVSLLACAEPANPAVEAPAAAEPQEPAQDRALQVLPLAKAANAITDALEQPDAEFALLRQEHRDLRALYSPAGHAPLWVDAGGQPSQSARDALALLRTAADDGLDPADYDAARLDALAAELASLRPPPPTETARFDVGLSLGLLRYLRHLHLGRVNPAAIGFEIAAPAHAHDFPALIASALAAGRIKELAADLAPTLPLYAALRAALARYRSLAADPSLSIVPQPTGRALRRGDVYTGLAAIRRLLVALGDVAEDAALPADGTYDGAIVEGVKRFQTRHGLDPDGVIGKLTLAALGVPFSWRVRQIELALERLRWLPDLGDRRFIALNIPMFQLWAWDSLAPSGVPTFGMNAIVGRALRTQTPVFVEEMRYVIFRPYWNVPPSILRNEILPRIEEDPEYLRKEDMEIVRGPGDDATPVEATAENIALLRQGLLRVRQRPGPDNALGLVKFMFPNDENVYMHDTPAKELFSRARRDFSHGCVRVQRPVDLAQWVLQDQPEWTRERILEAMAGPTPRRVDLIQPIQVILYYVTAIVVPEDGTVWFAEDIYRHDARLDRALERRRTTR
jgi:murein L,D-transpeptidase YcbB/YkuD